MSLFTFSRAFLLAMLMTLSVRIVVAQCTAPTASKTDVTDCLVPNGSLTFTNPKPFANYEFSIDGGITFGAPGVITFTGLDAGTYPMVSRLISSGCVSSVTNRVITKPAFVAGTAQSICLNQTITTTATPSSSASWTADAGNPSVTQITNVNDATTTIKGFTAVGTYTYAWGNGTCTDQLVVTVTNCDSPIGCTNTAFLIQQPTSFSSAIELVSIDIATGAIITQFSGITDPNRSINLNGMGYNVTDSELWGSVRTDGTDNVIGTGTIFRLGADGIPHYFKIPGLYTTGYLSGTIDANGILYLYIKDGALFRVDVNPASPTYLTLLSKSNTASMNIADFAYNPVDGFIYGVGSGVPHPLYKINPATGNVQTLGNVSADAGFDSGSLGAAYFDAEGNLYVGNNQSGGIYKISSAKDISGNTTAVLRSSGPASSGNDGAICFNACIKPDAGADIPAICMTASVTMMATQVSGINWMAQAGNPGTAIIMDPTKANTVINGFSAPGVYNFIWTNGGDCNDTTTVTVVGGCIVDTKVINLTCPTEPVIICNTTGAAGNDPGTTFSLGALSAADQLQGSLSLDANNCAVWTAQLTQSAVVNTYITACKGSVCDTTYITINPPAVPCALPVRLVSFTASKTETSSILLQWTTASEENSKEFAVEKSRDSKNWITMEKIAAATDSKNRLHYKSHDTQPYAGLNYYRLKMIDLDETFAYSQIRSLDVKNATEMILYPNPATGMFTIADADLSDAQKVELVNTAGIPVYRSSGIPAAEINIKGIPSGLYVVRITKKDGSMSFQKIMIK